MSHTRIARVAMAAVLGSALAAHAGAQEDSSAAPRIETGKPAPHGQARAPRPRHGEAADDGPRLGVMVQQTPDGLLVSSVIDDTLAAHIGIKAQDVILRIDDEHIESIADVQRTLSTRSVGETVSVSVIRPGEGIVTLSGPLPEPPARAPEPRQDGPSPDGQGRWPGADADRPGEADGFRGGFLGVQLVPERSAQDGPAPRDGEARPGEGKDGDAKDGAKHDAQPAPAGPGVEVEGVVPESAAWFAGLEHGDRILAVDGKELSSGSDLVGAVSGKQPGVFVELKYLHAGEERTARVRLGERRAAGELGALMPGLNFMPFGSQGGPGGGMLPRPRGAFGGIPHGNLQGFPFGGGGGGDDDLRDMPGHIQQFLQGMDLDAGNAQRQSVRVEMRDGKGTLTVTRDGQTEIYTLDDQGHWVKSGSSGATDPDAGAQDGAPSGTAQNGTHQGRAPTPLHG